MNYYKQVLTVTRWEYKRFFKLKNELIGIAVMLAMFTIGIFGGRYAVSLSDSRPTVHITAQVSEELSAMLEESFEIQRMESGQREELKQQIRDQKEGMLLDGHPGQFELFAYKKPGSLNRLTRILDSYRHQHALKAENISELQLANVLAPANLSEEYVYQPAPIQRRVLGYFFAGLMILAVFLSFAYQFTAITGEKQLKITEQIVSAIKPQVWMDGKILGITLTGLSSILVYYIIAILGGMLYFQFTGSSPASIVEYLHLPSILLFLVFSLTGILLWNALMAAIAAIITDPNNSGKSSTMLIPVIFVVLSFLVMREPDYQFSVFLSWFPLTSATAMPMRWLVTEIAWWQLAGSFALLAASFYFLRILAAKIFRVSILISGKEPSWAEVIRLAREN